MIVTIYMVERLAEKLVRRQVSDGASIVVSSSLTLDVMMLEAKGFILASLIIL